MKAGGSVCVVYCAYYGGIVSGFGSPLRMGGYFMTGGGEGGSGSPWRGGRPVSYDMAVLCVQSTLKYWAKQAPSARKKIKSSFVGTTLHGFLIWPRVSGHVGDILYLRYTHCSIPGTTGWIKELLSVVALPFPGRERERERERERVGGRGAVLSS